MKLKAVLFDLDGVIADTEPLHALAYVEAFGACGMPIDVETYRRAVTLGGKQAYAWFTELGGTMPAQHVYTLKDQCFREMLPELTPLDGVPELLGDLASHGVQLVIATGSRQPVARSVLDALGFTRYFRGIVAKDDVFRMKPDPEVYHRALCLVGAQPQNSVVIEDSSHGVRAGKAAEVFTVAVPTASTRQADFAAADLVVSSLSELSASALAEYLRARSTALCQAPAADAGPGANAGAEASAGDRIRLALPGDVPAIVDLLNRATLRLHGKGIRQWSYPWDAVAVESDIRAQHVHALLRGPRVIGSFSIRSTDGLQNPLVPPGCLYLYHVARSPECHDQQLGVKMVKYALQCARLVRLPLYLDCWAGNSKLRAYYSATGFEFVGDAPEGDYLVSVFRHG